MTAQIVQVPFYGSSIHTTRIAGEPVVVLKPTIEGMGLDYSAQLKKLKNRSWAVVVETATTGYDGKVYKMATVDLDCWAMLLANISENQVRPELRKTVIAYQKESAKALRLFWTEGAAVSPNITEAQAERTKTEIDEFIVARRQEQLDYRNVTRALAQGGALGKDYAQVQDTLYLGLFGVTARTIVGKRSQLSGERYKVGSRRGQLRPSKVAKNYLRETELASLNNAVLMLTSMLAIRFPAGTATLDDIKRVAIWVSSQAQAGRQLVAA